jgi:FkbM family methyltransferase
LFIHHIKKYMIKLKDSIKNLFVPLITFIFINIPSFYYRKKFAKLIGPYFDGVVAKTVYGFPMIAKWQDDMNRISFEGIDKDVEDFIINLPKDIMYIDIGAHQGLTSILTGATLKKNNYKGTILAFEPSTSSYTLLKKNLILNNCTYIKTFNEAVSSVKGKLHLDETNSDNSGKSHISKKGNSVISTPINIDKINKFDFYQNIYVKIDTEGYEMSVLQSLLNLFVSKLIFKVIIEIDDRYLGRFGNTPADIYNFFNKLDFKPTYGLKERGHYNEVFFEKKHL